MTKLWLERWMIILGYCLNFNCLLSQATTGTRSRNSSMRVEAAMIQAEDDDGCSYCNMEECVIERRGRRGSFESVFCYGIHNDEQEIDTHCTTNTTEMRLQVLSEHIDFEASSGCEVSKGNISSHFCWCKTELKRSLSKAEQVQERSRLRFNTGARGGVKVVHYQSADQKPIQQYESRIRSPQTLRTGPRVQASGLARVGATMTPEVSSDFHSRHLNNGNNKISNPRRPSSTIFSSIDRSLPSLLCSMITFTFTVIALVN